MNENIEDELAWVKYRISMLDIIERKLIQMRETAEKAKDENLSKDELEKVNEELSNLALQVNALDEESRILVNRE